MIMAVIILLIIVTINVKRYLCTTCKGVKLPLLSFLTFTLDTDEW